MELAGFILESEESVHYCLKNVHVIYIFQKYSVSQRNDAFFIDIAMVRVRELNYNST